MSSRLCRRTSQSPQLGLRRDEEQFARPTPLVRMNMLFQPLIRDSMYHFVLCFYSAGRVLLHGQMTLDAADQRLMTVVRASSDVQNSWAVPPTSVLNSIFETLLQGMQPCFLYILHGDWLVEDRTNPWKDIDRYTSMDSVMINHKMDSREQWMPYHERHDSSLGEK